MPEHPPLALLRDLLASLIIDPSDLHRVAGDALLPLPEIDFHGSAINIWTSMVTVAHQRVKLENLAGVVAGQYPGQRDALASLAQAAQREPAPYLQAASAGLQVIQQIGAVYNIQPAAQGGTRITASLKPRLDALLRRHTLFGGRQAELQKLDDFLARTAGGYCFITGPSGFGKTALLVNWLQRLGDAKQPLAYHFISRLDEVAGEEFALLNLCQQLVAYHDLRGSLPGRPVELRALYPQLLGIPPANGEKLVVILDGLDEAVGWQAGPDLFPHPLPDGVLVVFSAEAFAGKDWLTDLQLTGSDVTTIELPALSRDGIKHLLRQAGPAAAGLVDAAGFADSLQQASGGDPFYLRFLVEDIQAGKINSAQEVDRLIQGPHQGLDSYLDRWWQEIGQAAKDKPVRDLLGYLLVAKGRLSRDDLSAVSDEDDLDDWSVDEAIDQVRRYLVGDDQAGLTFTHSRFRDYVARARVREAARQPYRERLLAYCRRWQEHESRYALAYYAQHLADAFPVAKAGQQHPWAAQLVQLVVDEAFQEAHQRRLDDLVALQRDLVLALDIISRDSDDQALPLVIQCSLELVDFRRRNLRPEPIFRLAMNGQVDVALDRLALFELDGDWQQAVPLIIALLATYSYPETARPLRERMEIDLTGDDPLSMLAQRIDAALSGNPLPLFYLPPPPTIEAAQAMVARLAGQQANSELLSTFGPEPIAGQQAGQQELAFYAQQDARPLVAFAWANPGVGEDLFGQYLANHTGYFYPQYRRRTLWYLLDAVLRHPDPVWVHSMLPLLASAAISGSSVEFQEGLPLTLRALQGAAGDGNAAATFETRLAQAMAEIGSLHGMAMGTAPGGIGVLGGTGFGDLTTGDAFGFGKRRMLNLAQALHKVMGISYQATMLLSQALDLPHGFAGFQFPACLAVTEAMAVCSQQRAQVDRGLLASQAAAHNIQDPIFCVRSTARFNAMQARWWPPAGFDLEGAVARVVEDPSSAEFAALHRVGEPFEQRSPDGRLPISQARQANSLQALAVAFKRPLAEFQRLNAAQEWAAEEVLATGTEVNVPDPGFATQLAPRLAAEALVAPGLADDRRVALIQRLVPLAASNPTALDTVLARLLLAAHSRLTNASLLATLEQASAKSDWYPADPQATMITSFVP